MPRSFDSVFYGAGGGVELPSDDQFNRVSFLSHFEGANNGVNNSFDDGSADNLTITTAGNVTQGSFGPFARPDGEWGVSFDGSGDYLTVADSTEFDFGTGNFTIEGWISPAVTNSSFQAIFSIGNPVQIYSKDSNVLAYFNDQDNTYTYTINGLGGPSSSVSANTWAHFAVVRNGNTYTTYVNGVAGSSQTSSDTVASSGSAPAIGTYLPAPNTYGFRGYISNLRLVKGTALYTSNFTPSTSKLTAITNTKLLTCQSNRFIDNSASGHAITPTGTPAVTSFGPFLSSAVYNPAVNGASAYFNASSAILVASPPSFGPQSWTFECWFYFTGSTTYRMLFAQGPANGTDVSEFYLSSDGSLTFQVATSGANRIIMNTGSNVTNNNEWVHCALTHEYTSSTNSTYKIYQNGILGKTLNHTGGYNWSSGAGSGRPIVIGRSEWEGDYNGVPSYVQDSRLVVGSVVYTYAFTPPTAPLTAITNTKLLLNMADGQAIDSAAQSNLTLVGNANTSTDQAKFGNTSLHLTGSGDKANISGDLVNFGTSDFTLEGFFRIADMEGTDTYFFDGRDGTSGVLIPNILFDESNSNHVRVYSYPYIITGATDISLNTWYHLALCRSGSSLKLFLNGTQEGSTYTTLQNYVAGSFASIGGFAGGTQQSMVGFIDDFRISKFARYTANFTAPSEPFADKGQ